MASKLDFAARWLRRYLTDGPKPCGNRRKPKLGTVYGDGILRGMAGMTIRNAADTLKVKRKKVGKCWYWSLPEGCKEPPEPVAVPNPKLPTRKPKRRRRRLVITIAFE